GDPQQLEDWIVTGTAAYAGMPVRGSNEAPPRVRRLTLGSANPWGTETQPSRMEALTRSGPIRSRSPLRPTTEAPSGRGSPGGIGRVHEHVGLVAQVPVGGVEVPDLPARNEAEGGRWGDGCQLCDQLFGCQPPATSREDVGAYPAGLGHVPFHQTGRAQL